MRETLADFCRRKGLEHLLDQWDTVRNLPLTPDSIPYGSKRRVWWICGKSHDYQAAVSARTAEGAAGIQ